MIINHIILKKSSEKKIILLKINCKIKNNQLKIKCNTESVNIKLIT